MKNKNIFFTLYIIFIIAIGIYFSYVTFKIHRNGTKTYQLSDCEKSLDTMSFCYYDEGCVNISERDICYSDVAYARVNPSICDNIQNQIVKDMCYDSLALKMEDESLCEVINSENIKSKCFNNINFNKQVSTE